VKISSRTSLSEAWFVCCWIVPKEKRKNHNCSGSITGQCCNVLPQMSNIKSDDGLKQPYALWRASLFFYEGIFTSGQDHCRVIMCNDPDFMIWTFFFLKLNVIWVVKPCTVALRAVLCLFKEVLILFMTYFKISFFCWLLDKD